jgi:ceramide glucosyltransferase
MMMIAHLLLFVALAGLICCTGFLALIVVAAIRVRRRRCPRPVSAAALPPVSLLKPLCGLEPGLESHLASFFQQNYPRFEIVFGTRNAEDPALEIVEAVRRRYPKVPVKVVFSGEPDRPNAKVCSLERMVAAASFEYLIISDSDVRVNSEYIERVVEPLLDPQVGLVTCLYRGVPTGGLWSRLEAMGMSVEMTSGVIVADTLEGMKFALGPTMATRRDVIESIGGLQTLASYCADDYVLGEKVYESGRKVVLSSHVIDHVVINRDFQHSIDHQIRWMRSTRFSRPRGHIGTGLTFAIPFGLLGLIAGVAVGNPEVAAYLLAWAVVNRWLMALIAGWGVVRDRASLLYCWLYPVRDFMGFCFWAASFAGETIIWRQQQYRLLPGGAMLRVPNPDQSAPDPVAVDSLA